MLITIKYNGVQTNGCNFKDYFLPDFWNSHVNATIFHQQVELKVLFLI